MLIPTLFRIKEEHKKGLKDIAKREEIPVSILVRKIFDQFIKEYKIK